jgi:hypothetical protein
MPSDPVIESECPDPFPLRFVEPAEKAPGSGIPNVSGGFSSKASNWITAGWCQNTTGAPITCFRAQWKVPKPPRTHRHQQIFLFNGMQPRRPTAILQPVLTWGCFGTHWSVSSWFRVTTGHSPPPTPPFHVKHGETLTGVLQLIDEGGAGFSYRCQFEGIGQTVLTVHNVAELACCAVALEAYESGSPPYELKKPSDYPNAKRTRFRRIKIEAGVPIHSLQWQCRRYLEAAHVPNYGEYTAPVSDSATKGKVDIYHPPRGCLWA